MITHVKLKLLSPFLGSGRPDNIGDPKPILYARRGCPKLFKKEFIELINTYIKNEGLSCGEALPPTWIDISSAIKIDDLKIQIVDLPYYQKNGVVTKVKVEQINEGTILELAIKFNSKVLSKDNLIKILNCIGEFEGISQYGTERGYGKYEVIN